MILEKMKAEREESRQIIADVLKDVFSSAGLATRSDLKEIRDRLDYLGRKTSRIETAGGKGAKRKTGARRKSGGG
ncbi:MAG: hypothetical protein AB1742_08495 [bacterium]